ncbi:Metalloenzyme, LuxS/M16 peptidase-like protein [Pisolithus marmoratus]|nr:Metalloenzyme, LuxS/M16 peptidase-like protein [Pisolithus marmoratus]
MTVSDWKEVPQNHLIPPYSIFTRPLEKSQVDDRQYNVIRLKNGLTAMLVHDPCTENAAASLNVAVGHLSDPDDMPGLAHFCEHLLFMGTKQFPKENEYSEYLSKNNGGSNAYTSSSNTNYHFRVSPPALPGALERFSGFFHSPLFAPSCTTRELNAVDSEHKKNHQADPWRIFQLNKTLSKAGHPWSKFGTGNRATLTAVGRETRRRLIEWWSKEYCASRMELCVIGREPLEELAGMVSRLFSPIPNHGQGPPPLIDDHPFGPNEMGTLVSVQTIMSFHAVEISFPLAWQPPLWKYKPGYFLSHFLGHEGHGSLFAYLKGKGWITSLSAATQALGRGFAMFKTTMYPHEEWFCSEFPRWFQTEITTIAKTQFQFAEKRAAEGYAVTIAERMSWPVPTEKLLSAPALISEWEGDEGERQVREALENLQVDSGRVVLMAKKEEHERISDGEKAWQSEKWYGTGYTVERWDDQFLNEARSPNDIPDLHLPGRNEFIPTNLDPQHRPHLIRQSDISKVWYKKDDQFWLPRAAVASDKPRTTVLTKLCADLVNDSLTEYTYDAELAGLAYHVTAHSLGMTLTLKGYNDKLPELAKYVVRALRNLVPTQDRLDVMKEKLKREWDNFFMNQSYHLSDYYGRYMLTHQTWTIQELLEELPGVQLEEVAAHIRYLLNKINIQTLVLGNMYRDQAIALSESVEDILNSAPLAEGQVPSDRALILPEGSNYTWTAPVPNPNEANSALTYYIHLGELNDPRHRVVGTLLARIMSEPAFNILRTKEQLGYIVSCSRWLLHGDSQFGMRIIVQSERGTGYLEERVEAFLDTMGTKLEEMENQEFEDFKKGMQQRWREPAKNLGEEASKYWHHIDSGFLDFLRRFENADLIEKVEKHEVVALFRERVHPKALKRAKLSVHMQSQKPRPPRISSKAVEAFEALVREADIPIDLAVTKDEFDRESPVAADFLKHWNNLLSEDVVSTNVARDVLGRLPALMEQYPVRDENVYYSADVTRVEDIRAFKATLDVSPPPQPLVDWGDLPNAKL